MSMRPFLLLASLAVVSPALAENWGQWRGPAFNGSSPETGLPTEWNAERGTEEHVRWKTKLPGASGATPAIWGDSVFVSSPDENRNLCLLCLNRKDGKLRWSKTVMEAANMVNGRANSASPSPVTDGKAVFVAYSSGDVAAFDYAGQELWRRSLGQEYGKPAFQWLYGSSPLLYEGKLYVQVLQRTPAPEGYPGIAGAGGERESYLLAMDPATGKTIWKQSRPSEARAESKESYGTPIPHVAPDGKRQILVVGGDCLTGHDAATGKELWRAYGINRKRGETMRVVASPVSAGGLAIACGPKKEQLIAVRTDLRGDVSENGIAWTFDEKKTPDVCTPAYADGKLFVLDGDSATLTCLDAKTGAKRWQGNLGDRTVIRSSPTVADGKVYIINEKGTVFICGAGDEFKLIKSIPMSDPEGTRASIAISDKQLFIRTTENLYCIE